MNKNKNMIRTIVGSALFVALTVVFTEISNYIQIVPGVTINLSLLTIALSAILYGWKGGLIVGLVNGILVYIGPSGQFFAGENAIITPIICLLKTGLAGVVSSLLFNLISKKNLHVAVFASCIIVPLLNTAVFMGLTYLFFPIEFFLTYCIPGFWNFILEMAVSIVLAPSVFYIIKNYINKKQKILEK